MFPVFFFFLQKCITLFDSFGKCCSKTSLKMCLGQKTFKNMRSFIKIHVLFHNVIAVKNQMMFTKICCFILNLIGLINQGVPNPSLIFTCYGSYLNKSIKIYAFHDTKEI